MAKKQQAETIQLAEEAYPELNATLYQSSPAEYFQTRLGTLLGYLSRADRPDATPVTYSLGAMHAEWQEVNPDHETKLRYAAMEASILLHHAGETLLRLYLAHAQEPRCPWLSVARLRNFVEFKNTIGSTFKAPVADAVMERIALVFLGGRTPAESAVQVSAESWDEAILAYTELLSVMTDKLFDEANLYNAAKHGLVGVPHDSGSLTFGEDDERVTVGGGPAMLFLSQIPAAQAKDKSPEERWSVTSAYVRIDSSLMMVDLITRAVSSLWAAARRRYCGSVGEILLLKRDTVWGAAFAPMIAAGHIGSAVSYQVPIKKRDGAGVNKIQPPTIQLKGMRLGAEVLDSYDRVNGVRQSVTLVTITPRPGDFAPQSPSGRTLFSFSPPGFSVV